MRHKTRRVYKGGGGMLCLTEQIAELKREKVINQKRIERSGKYACCFSDIT